MATVSPIGTLPDEILQHVLFYVSAADALLNVQLVSRRFLRVSNEPLLWRFFCRTQFKYWDPKHQISKKFAGNVGDMDWKTLYLYRMKVDEETSKTLDSILSKQTRRIEKIERIGHFGYDAKDTLLRHCSTGESADDYLARRFYSTAVLDHVHRAKALEEWHKLGKEESVPLERALGSFDMFILHDQRGDLSETSYMLDGLAARLRSAQPNFDALSQRNKAIAIAQFLRQNNLTGITSERRYRDLKNNYISIALQDQKHHSLPLISVAIYCSLAQGLGLDARSCAFPSHVIAIIYPNNNESLDGPLSNSSREVAEPMYLDPWRSDIEVPAEQLRTQLQEWGVASADFPRYMNDTSTRNLVIRTSRNIVATFQEFRGGGDGANVSLHQPSVQLYSNPFADMDHAIYSALWANFLVNTPARAVPVEQLEFVPLILERFERLYSMDAIFMEQYLCPSSSSDARANHNRLALLETIRVVRAGDSMPKQVRRRDTEVSQTKVLYHVGQVFQHKRYRYDAVITGWDVECTMNSTWIAENHVDTLSKGRHQSFYHVLVADNSIRYVAEENIEIVKPEYPLAVIGLAGRFFKRWDHESRKFISNIQDEYPDG